MAFVQGIHRWPVNSRHKRPVTRKMFPFDDVIMSQWLVIDDIIYSMVFLQIEQGSYFELAKDILYTVKPVCNDHLPDNIYYLWFIQ